MIGALDGVEHALMDTRFALGKRSVTSDVVVVSIDNPSIKELKQWPWPRRYHGEVIDRLLAAGAGKIALDIDLSSVSNPEDDRLLVESLEKADGRVVLPVFKQRVTPGQNVLVYTEPMAAMREHTQTAAINVRPDTDSVIRQYARAETWNNTYVPALATQLSGVLPQSLAPFYIDFSADPGTIRHLSYADVRRGRFNPIDVRGKTVLIGATAVELGDMFGVPNYSVIPGVALQALAYDSIISGRMIERSPQLLTLVAALFVALFLGPFLVGLSWRAGLATIGGLIVTAAIGAMILQAHAAVSLDITPPLITGTSSFLLGLVGRIDIMDLEIFRRTMAGKYKRAMMSAVVNDGFDGIVIADTHGRVQLINPAASKLLGWSQDEAIGERVFMVLRTKHHDMYPAAHIEAGHLESVVLLEPTELELNTRDKGVIHAELSLNIAALTTSDSKFEKRSDVRFVYIYTFRDISARHEAAVALQEAADQAIAADRSKTQFIANISHELRTPLNAIIGFSDILVTQIFGPVGNEKYHEYAQDIHASGVHLLGLINDVLALSKMESGKFELDEHDIDLISEIVLAVKISNGLPGAEQRTLKLELPDGKLMMLGDGQALKQVILNLLGNAMKFTEPGGTITTKLWVDENNHIFFSVTDDGIGIDDENLAHITEPFYQIEGAMQRSHGGTGLGLHIVNRLVRLHGGSMTIDSEIEVGTTIIVSLPAERYLGKENVISLAKAKNKIKHM
jgi:PAS domain S-box-containing protein